MDKKNLYALIGVVFVFLLVGIVWYFFIYQDREQISQNIESEHPIEIKVPDAWNKNGEVLIPEYVETPNEAVEKVDSIPGYEKESIESAEAIQGTSGEWYWSIKTDKGYVTIEGETQ